MHASNALMTNHENIRAILILGSYLSVPYFLAGLTCGWLFIRWLTKVSKLRSFGLSLVVHFISSISALIVIPAVVFTIFRSTASWQTIMFLDFLTGVPQCALDAGILYLFTKRRNGMGDFGKLYLWKIATLMICLLVCFPAVVLYFMVP